MRFQKIIKDMLTGKDGESTDVGRVGLAATGAVFLFLAVWAVVVNHEHFDPQGFGIGAAGLLAGGGACLGLKAKTEPDPEPNS